MSIHLFKNKYFLSSNSLTTRVQQYLMIDKINQLKPSNVLEVDVVKDFSYYYYRLFHKISFTGIDQSGRYNFANNFKNETLDEILTKHLIIVLNERK